MNVLIRKECMEYFRRSCGGSIYPYHQLPNIYHRALFLITLCLSVVTLLQLKLAKDCHMNHQ